MKNLIRRHILFPILVLLAVAVMGSIWTYFMVSGSTPFTIRNIGVENADGAPQTVFKPGEVVGIRRELCSSQDLGIEFYPSLRTQGGGVLPLGHSAAFMRKDCRQTVFLFVLPSAVPAGHYQYLNVVKYQTNLIGRDELTVYPPLELEVVNVQ